MRTINRFTFFLLSVVLICSCSHDDDDKTNNDPFSFTSAKLDHRPPATFYRAVSQNPTVRLTFSEPVDRNSAASAITLLPATSPSIPVNISFENADSTVV